MKRTKKMQVSVLALSALIAMAGAVPAQAVVTDYPESEYNDWEDGDIIDDSEKGSLAIHKYDITAAEAAGDYQAGQIKATGEVNSQVENALAKYGIEGVQFTYRKLGDVETHSVADGQTQSIELVYEIPTDLASLLGLGSSDAVDMTGEGEANPCSNTGVYHYTSQQLTDALADVLADDVAAKNALEGYVYDYEADAPVSGAVNMPMTDETGYTQVEDLALGLYLVVETEVPENVTSTVNPWLVSLPFTNSADEEGEEGGQRWLYDMTCYPKNQTGNPTLDKSVRDMDSSDDTYGNTTTASTGDVLEYTLLSKLPHISSTATYLTQYAFVDTLSKGLTYNQDVKIAFYHEASAAEENQTDAADLIWDTSSDCFRAATQASTAMEDGTELTITITEKGLAALNESYSDYYMVAYYTVTLNKDATTVLGDEGNSNEVQLIWSRTSDGYYDTLEDENFVYSYGINLTKYFSDKKGDFTKVQFKLYNENDNNYVCAEKAEDGIYYVTGRTDDKEQAATFTPNKESGVLQINGLEADRYLLTEVATDDGYSLLKSPIEITITATDRDVVAAVAGVSEMSLGEIQPASAAIDSVEATMTENHAAVILSVTNSKGLPLPQTGGNGLYAVTILGMLTVAGGCLLMGRKKQSEEE